MGLLRRPVLLLYRRYGPTQPANDTLESAFKTNPHVPLYLLLRRGMPKRLPDYVGFGDDNEAVSYVYGAIEAWVQTDGALSWLRKRYDSADADGG